MNPSRIGPLGSAHSAMVPCMSSSDFLLRRFSFCKRGWHLLMTRPDPLLNPAPRAYVDPGSLEVCSQADNRSFMGFNHRRRRASHACGSISSWELFLTLPFLSQPS